MAEEIVIQLAQIVILGTLAQWVAWRARLPSILLLLGVGVVAGPITGWLHPDALAGDLLLPMTSLSVAVILYEGGLSLRLRELRSIGGAFASLTTIGAAVSWALIAAAAHWVLGFTWSIATLLGAILVVTGPTVIGPILRHLRLRGPAGTMLKWEGIVIDPVGASLAVLVFVVIQAGSLGEGIARAALGLGLTLVIGAAAGLLAGFLVGLALSRFWVPDSLHNPISLMVMFAAFTLANALQQDAGLLAVTVMGLTLANMKGVPIRRVVEFKETLAVLLIPALFVLLAARLRPDDLRALDWRSLVFVGLLVAVARPLAVLISTRGSSLTWKERAFLSCMAPRGIVAAAISSVFAAQLTASGQPGAESIVPVVFLVVFATVLLYGLAAAPLARALGLTQANPQGVLFVGAQRWARALAQALRQEGMAVFLVDTNWENIRQSRMAGLPCLYGNALAEEVRESVDLTGLGRMLAMTSNDEVNSLACQLYADDFGRKEVYQLPFPASKKGVHEPIPFEHRGRLLMQPEMAFARLDEWVGPEASVRKTKLTTEFDERSLRQQHGDNILPVFLRRREGLLRVWTIADSPEPRPGDMVISLIRHSG